MKFCKHANIDTDCKLAVSFNTGGKPVNTDTKPVHMLTQDCKNAVDTDTDGKQSVNISKEPVHLLKQVANMLLTLTQSI